MTEHQTRPVLKIRNLVKTKGDPLDTSFTLEIPELTINPGEIVAIVGEAGTGKTTLLDLVSMVSPPDHCADLEISAQTSGQARDVMTLASSSHEASHAGTRPHVGYVPQAGALLPFLSIWENVALPSKIFGRRVPATRIMSIASSLGIGNKLDLFPKHLSSAQRQRAEILRAIAHRPSLILTDDLPESVSPPRALKILHDLKNIIADQSEAALIATSSYDLVEDIADRIYTFHRTPDASGRHIRSVCTRMDPPALLSATDQARLGSELVH